MKKKKLELQTKVDILNMTTMKKKLLKHALILGIGLISMPTFAAIKIPLKPMKLVKCGEWSNFRNADGNIAYRTRECDGYTQKQTFDVPQP
jgi:hypothetical protein